MSLQADLKFGKKNEDKVLGTLREHFKCDLAKSKRCSDYFDYHYEGDDKLVKVELKSRRNAKNKYPTTMIGKNKIDAALKLIKEGYEIYLCFNFTDGLYYTRFDENSKYETKQGGRWDRGRPEVKDYCYFPVDNLSKI